MVGTMEEATGIPGYFKNKGILITGSTGFLGKILVEKILRVQPDVKRIYLPVRAPDAASARKRVETEVIGKELFGLLRETHGKGFQSFIEEKVVALAGDIIHENFGVEGAQLSEMTREINVIVNGAATTNFYERYDVALDVNVMGVKHMCQLARQCPNLEVILHVSTAYVVGERQGLIQERPFKYGETLRDDDGARPRLDVDAEVKLARDYQRQLADDDAEQKNERKAMKELGLARAREFGWPNTYVFTKALGEMTLGRLMGGGDVPVVIVRPSIITSIQRDPLPGWIEGTRTIDAILIGYAKQNLSCFLADLDLTMDVIPGDMVVSAMMAAAAAHASPPPQPAPAVYHATSSLRNPAPYAVLNRAGMRYFNAHPRRGPDGRPVRTRRIHFFATVAAFTAYMVVRYRLPLELLRLLNLLCCGLLGRRCAELGRKYAFVMRLVDLYGPFALFRGVFDDANVERLRRGMADADRAAFNFDPKTLDWDDYFYRVHIPGVMKYVLK